MAGQSDSQPVSVGSMRLGSWTSAVALSALVLTDP